MTDEPPPCCTRNMHRCIQDRIAKLLAEENLQIPRKIEAPPSHVPFLRHLLKRSISLVPTMTGELCHRPVAATWLADPAPLPPPKAKNPDCPFRAGRGYWTILLSARDRSLQEGRSRRSRHAGANKKSKNLRRRTGGGIASIVGCGGRI